MPKVQKTNALRILDRQKINYKLHTYDAEDKEVTGRAVAKKINKHVDSVFKTIVTYSGNDCFVFVIPVEAELHLKKAAKVAKVKKLDLLPVKELQAYTGYIRGGCSPVGMKKEYKTWIDETALQLEEIIVSAGKIGLQMEVNVQALATSIRAQFAQVIERDSQ